MSDIKDRQMEGLKLPPHSLEAEQSVLGGLMIDNERWDNVSERVTAEDFYSRPHRTIFSQMQRLLELGKPIDLITLSEALEQNAELDSVGGFAYLAELSKNTPSAANINAYADIVRERAVVRDMIKVANEIADAGFDPQGRTSEDLLDFAESRVFQIAETRANKDEGPKAIEAILEETVEKIEQLYQKPHDGVTGVSSGYQDLDKKTAGLQKSDLIIVAARPSMGKTTFAMNLAEGVLFHENLPVIVFSMEMPAESIVMRLLSSWGQINQTSLRSAQMNEDEWARMMNAISHLQDKHLYIDDSTALPPSEVRSRCRRIAKNHDGKVGMVIVDYLQLMKVPSLSGNRVEEISEISRSLKALARELNCPVIALSQLNRSLENRPNKRPIMSDLRESGAIEQDADLITFIYRDEVYNENSDLKGVAEIIIGKQRNGPIGTVRLAFEGQYTRFINLTPDHYMADASFENDE